MNPLKLAKMLKNEPFLKKKLSSILSGIFLAKQFIFWLLIGNWNVEKWILARNDGFFGALPGRSAPLGGGCKSRQKPPKTVRFQIFCYFLL